VRRGAATVAGADRVEIIGPDGAIHDTRLRVAVKANAEAWRNRMCSSSATSPDLWSRSHRRHIRRLPRPCTGLGRDDAASRPDPRAAYEVLQTT
jgi:hypothetical protein